MPELADHVLVLTSDIPLHLAAAGTPDDDVVHHSLVVGGYSDSGSVERTLLAEAHWVIVTCFWKVGTHAERTEGALSAYGAQCLTRLHAWAQPQRVRGSWHGSERI